MCALSRSSGQRNQSLCASRHALGQQSCRWARWAARTGAPAWYCQLVAEFLLPFFICQPRPACPQSTRLHGTSALQLLIAWSRIGCSEVDTLCVADNQRGDAAGCAGDPAAACHWRGDREACLQNPSGSTVRSEFNSYLLNAACVEQTQASCHLLFSLVHFAGA